MKMKTMIAILALGTAVATVGAASADEYEIHMLNKGEKGVMVFEPDFLSVQPGDTVRFVPVDKGHNAESIKGMLPEGAEPFKGKMSKELSVTFDQDGVYGVKCMPHYGMGMVALIEVGEPKNLDTAETVKHPGKAAKRFAELFGDVVAAN